MTEGQRRRDKTRDFVEMKKEHWIAYCELNYRWFVHKRIQIWWQLEILLLRMCVIRFWSDVTFICLPLFVFFYFKLL